MWSLLVLPLLAQLFASVGCDGVKGNYKIDVDNSTEIQGLWDLEMPFGVHPSAIYKKSTFYRAVKTVTPSILSNVIDSLNRDKVEIAQTYGCNSLDDLQYVTDSISQLRNEVLTNQPLTPLVPTHRDAGTDFKIWNNYLHLRREVEGPNLSWFYTRILLAETYIFRRITQALRATEKLATFDPFGKQKQALFTDSIDTIKILARHTIEMLSRSSNGGVHESKRELRTFLKLSMWANRLDLGIRVEGINVTGDPIDQLNSFDAGLLIDDTDVIWNILMTSNKEDNLVIVDIVLDNAGYELFTDICLASFLINHGLAHQIRFHVKQIPWAISDVTNSDWKWMIEYMRTSTDPYLKRLANLCMQHLRDKTWVFETTNFWTTFYDYGQMKKQRKDLYQRFSEAALVIFKGGLNYEKLIGDINWDHTTTLDAVLERIGFRPTSVVALATIKSEICVGLNLDQVRLWKSDKESRTNGTYGVINAAAYSACACDENP